MQPSDAMLRDMSRFAESTRLFTKKQKRHITHAEKATAEYKSERDDRAADRDMAELVAKMSWRYKIPPSGTVANRLEFLVTTNKAERRQQQREWLAELEGREPPKQTLRYSPPPRRRATADMARHGIEDGGIESESDCDSMGSMGGGYGSASD